MISYKAQPLDLMQWINEKYHEPFIHARIELDTPLNIARLTEAVERLLDLFPLLKCVYRSGENVFFESEALSAGQLICTVDPAAPVSPITESLTQQLIRFTVSDKTLYVTVSHIVCDGSGFKQLLYLLCGLYNGQDIGDAGYVMRRDLSLLTENLKGKKTATARMLVSMLGKYPNQPIYQKAPNEKAYWMERILSKADMQTIHASAKAQGATLNDAFLTAYARALQKQCGFQKMNIPCTVDLRKYADAPMGIANLTGTYGLNVSIDPAGEFRHTLSAVAQQMQKQKKTKNDIAGPMLLVSKYRKSSLEKFMKLYGGIETSAFTDYTNLGILDEKKLNFVGASVNHATAYSVLSKAPCFQLAFSSFKGETTLSCLCLCADSERSKAEAVLETTRKELLLFAGG